MGGACSVGSVSRPRRSMGLLLSRHSGGECVRSSSLSWCGGADGIATWSFSLIQQHVMSGGRWGKKKKVMFLSGEGFLLLARLPSTTST